MLKRFALLLMAMMLVVPSAFAATHTVGAAGDFTDISAAIADGGVVNGDVLVVIEDIADNAVVTKEVTIMGQGMPVLTDAGGGSNIIIDVQADNVVVKNLTFDLANGDIGVNAGSAAITSLNVAGNTFEPTDTGQIGVAFNLAVGAFTVNNVLFGGNVCDGSSVAIDAADNASVLQTVKIYSNVFMNADGVNLDVSAGALVVDAFTTGTLDIKGNNFGASVTAGHLYQAFNNDAADADLVQANVHINYNTIKYIQNGAGTPQVNSTTALGAGDGFVDATFNSWGSNTAPATTIPLSGTVGVVDATNFTSTNFLTTSNSIVPNVTATETADLDADGKFDALKVTLDNFLDPNSLSNAGISVAGYTLARAPRLATDGNVFNMIIYVTETDDAFDTGATPSLAYTGTGIKDLVGQTFAAFTATPTDKIAPRVVSAVTGDLTSNGKIDAIAVVFTEPMFSISASLWSLGINNFGNDNPDGAPYVVPPGGAVQSPANTVTFVVTEFIPAGADLYDTDVTPAFELNNNNQIRDLAGNQLVPGTAVTAVDGAAPVAVSASTADTQEYDSVAEAWIAGTDGYIDTFKILFSEDITAGVGDDPKLSASTVENAISIGDDTITDDAGNQLTVVGVNQKTTELVSLHPWDTDATPDLTLDSPAGDVTDAAGNAWAAFMDGVLTMTTTDMALPVLVQLEGMQGTNDLYMTFSEAISGTGDAINDDFNLVVAGDLALTYNDNGNADGGVTGILLTDPIQDANGTDAIIIMNVNGNFATRDFDSSSAQGIQTPDNVNVASASIIDIADNHLVAKALDIIVYDVTAPTIDRIRTKDLDMDGWVDHIYVRFTENIIDEGVIGFMNNASINTTAAQYIAVEGYTVVGINNFNTASILSKGKIVYSTWDDVTAAAGPNVAVNADGRAICPDETAAVNGLTSGGDNLNDNTMWIMVKEMPDGMVGGDTAATPTVTILGSDANGIRFADKKLNYVATVTDAASDDYAPPAIMSASHQSFYVLNVNFSENLANPQAFTQNELLGGPDFTVLSNPGGSNISDKVESIVFGDGDNQLVFTLNDDTPIDYDQNVMIAFSKTGAVSDPEGRSNNQVASNWNAGAEATGENGSFIIADVLGVDTTSIRPGSNPTVLDYPGDNGYNALVRFRPASSPDVLSYQFYLRNETNITEMDFLTDAPAVEPDADTGYMYYIIPVPFNGTVNIGVRGSTGTFISPQRGPRSGVVTAKVAGIEAYVVEPYEGAEKIAPVNISDVAMVDLETSEPVEDNLGFAPIRTYSITDAPGANTGILLTWVTPQDAENATEYQIQRRISESSDWSTVGTVPVGTTEFIHKINDSTTAYQYRIVTRDDNVDHTLYTDFRTVIAYAGGGDFDSSGTVDFPDFIAFAGAYNTSFDADPEGFIAAYDMNGDGVVNFTDFIAFAGVYGQTSGGAAKLVTSIPSTDVALDLSATIDEASSMYYVTVNVDPTIDGLQYYLSYDSNALDYVDVTGLSGLSMPIEASNGVVRVAAEFVGDAFDGAITLGFKSKGVESDLDFEIVNGIIHNAGEMLAVTNLGAVSLKALPTVYALSQNFPNPFNPTTTIEYQIPQSGHVELVVYNMAGQKVRTLVSETQDASFYKVVWDSRNDSGEAVASGLYFYKLVSGNFSKIEKMTLLK